MNPGDVSRLGACAARGDAEGAAEVLGRLGRSPNEMISTTLAMFDAESKGHTEVVRVLLEDGRADPAWNDNQVLRTAIVRDRVAIVRLLLADGRADPGTGCSYPLRLAALSRRHEVLQLLLEDGRADPAAFDSAALVASAYGGYIDGDFGHTVRLLLADGRADVFQVGRCDPDLVPMIRAARCWRRRRPWLRAVA
jgi:hypothetical protein